VSITQYGIVKPGFAYVLTYTTLPSLQPGYRAAFERSARSFRSVKSLLTRLGSSVGGCLLVLNDGGRPQGGIVKIAGTAFLAVAMALAIPAAVLAARSGAEAAKAPVSSFVDPTFGKVLSRTDKQVLYYWNASRRRPAARCAASAIAPSPGRR
jgi:hypothetical protein